MKNLVCEMLPTLLHENYIFFLTWKGKGKPKSSIILGKKKGLKQSGYLNLHS